MIFNTSLDIYFLKHYYNNQHFRKLCPVARSCSALQFKKDYKFKVNVQLHTKSLRASKYCFVDQGFPFLPKLFFSIAMDIDTWEFR